jgi:Tfp pilus assembly protein PilF
MGLTETTSREYRIALGNATSIYTTQKEYQKALAGHEELVKLHPDDAWLWGNYANFLFYRNQDIDGSIEKSREAISHMDYGIARSTLANALFTKWAELKDDAETQAEAEQYFAEAYALQPNIKLTISKLVRYKHTKKAATALQAWLIENDNEEEAPQRI